MEKYRITLQILFLLFMLGCEFFKSADKTEQLPPATQEGKNTFGCLVNGKVWLPKGSNGTSNLDASYDPTFHGGSLSIYSYSITDGINQFLAFGGDSIATTGDYPLSTTSRSPGAYFDDQLAGCSYDEPQDIVGGHFNITKLDISNGVIAGTFEVSFSKADCATIHITQGRFDLKL